MNKFEARRQDRDAGHCTITYYVPPARTGRFYPLALRLIHVFTPNGPVQFVSLFDGEAGANRLLDEVAGARNAEREEQFRTLLKTA